MDPGRPHWQTGQRAAKDEAHWLLFVESTLCANPKSNEVRRLGVHFVTVAPEIYRGCEMLWRPVTHRRPGR